jgi:hypothetical protein
MSFTLGRGGEKVPASDMVVAFAGGVGSDVKLEKVMTVSTCQRLTASGNLGEFQWNLPLGYPIGDLQFLWNQEAVRKLVAATFNTVLGGEYSSAMGITRVVIGPTEAGGIAVRSVKNRPLTRGRARPSVATAADGSVYLPSVESSLDLKAIKSSILSPKEMVRPDGSIITEASALSSLYQSAVSQLQAASLTTAASRPLSSSELDDLEEF